MQFYCPKERESLCYIAGLKIVTAVRVQLTLQILAWALSCDLAVTQNSFY